MASLIIGLLAETPIHAGVGRNLGVIDLPVAREAATDYPVIVGSSLKGALKDHASPLGAEQVKKLFGQQAEAGQLLVSDARILMLPVRSLTGQYRWVTCPHILERLARDKRRAGLKVGWRQIPATDGQALGKGNSPLFLEEREFSLSNEGIHEDIITAVSELVGNAQAKARVALQLVILSNDDFAWFARYGLHVQARNVLDEQKKTSKNLWYEETLPPDTVMYALISERSSGDVNAIRKSFEERPYLQVGGNETVGQGIFLVQPLAEQKETEQKEA